MKLSFSTLGCPDWTLEQIAEGAAQCGYDGVELRVADDGIHLAPGAAPEAVTRAAEAFAAAGVPVISLAGYASFSSPDAEVVRANQDLARRLIGLAERLGARWVRIYGGAVKAPDSPDAAAGRIAAALKPLADEAAARGVALAAETHDSWCDGAKLMEIVGRVASPGLGVVYDVYNTFAATGEWRRTYEQVKQHVCYWHVKDGYRAADGSGQHIFLGAGDLPIHDILARLKADGFDGFLSFEWEKRWCPHLEAPERVLPQYAHKMRALWDAV